MVMDLRHECCREPACSRGSVVLGPGFCPPVDLTRAVHVDEP